MDEMAKQYEDYVDAEFEKGEDENGFTVRDLGKANWCVKQIARLQHDVDMAERYVDQEIERLQKWLIETKVRKQKSIDFFESALRPFVAEQLVGAKTKTLELPNGSCSFKKAYAKWEKDDKELLAYLERNNESAFIEVKRTPKWGEFKKTLQVADGRVVTADGEILDFVKVTVPDVDDFKVKVKEG